MKNGNSNFDKNLSIEKCMKTVTLIFADALRQELAISRESSKEDLATVLSYFRLIISTF
jgi:hypothetical protein